MPKPKKECTRKERRWNPACRASSQRRIKYKQPESPSVQATKKKHQDPYFHGPNIDFDRPMPGLPPSLITLGRKAGLQKGLPPSLSRVVEKARLPPSLITLGRKNIPPGMMLPFSGAGPAAKAFHDLSPPKSPLKALSPPKPGDAMKAPDLSPPGGVEIPKAPVAGLPPAAGFEVPKAPVPGTEEASQVVNDAAGDAAKEVSKGASKAWKKAKHFHF